jgi:hypothetical protein
VSFHCTYVTHLNVPAVANKQQAKTVATKSGSDLTSAANKDLVLEEMKMNGAALNGHTATFNERSIVLHDFDEKWDSTDPPSNISRPKTIPEEEDEEEEDGAHHVSGVPLILLALGLCITVFLIGLDQMIIATAIPKITKLFNSLGDVGWYVHRLVREA